MATSCNTGCTFITGPESHAAAPKWQVFKPNLPSRWEGSTFGGGEASPAGRLITRSPVSSPTQWLLERASAQIQLGAAEERSGILELSAVNKPLAHPTCRKSSSLRSSAIRT